jgi:tetratricopeptide (TPR) repeat protein
MTSLRLSAGFLIVAGLIAVSPARAPAQKARDQEIFNQAKILMFDKDWEAARSVFLRIIRDFPSSNVVPEAYFFNARCLQLQGRQTEAIPAYEDFLRRYPGGPVLPAEARSAVVEMAASLFEKGDPSYKDRLINGLMDERREVRYFTALRCSYLRDRSLNSMIVPILREIVQQENEREIADRARIALLRIDPKALSEPTESRKPPKEPPKKDKQQRIEKRSDARMFHLVVYEEGIAQPRVELNIPFTLAQLAVAALDESTKKEMRKKGVDVDNVWESLNRMGPADILTFRDGKNVVKIWIK